MSVRSAGVYRETRRKPTRHRPYEGDNFLAPAVIVAGLVGAGVTTVRKYCRPIACDADTRALLYDAAVSVDVLHARIFRGDTQSRS